MKTAVSTLIAKLPAKKSTVLLVGFSAINVVMNTVVLAKSKDSEVRALAKRNLRDSAIGLAFAGASEYVARNPEATKSLKVVAKALLKEATPARV